MLASLEAKATVTDKTYAGILVSALVVSVLILCTSYYVSRDPIFSKEAFKFPLFLLHRRYDSLPQHAQNGNGVHHKEKKRNPEPLKGWRFRMGVLLNLVLVALVVVHALILVFSGPTLLRIVFIMYWVHISQSGQC